MEKTTITSECVDSKYRNVAQLYEVEKNSGQEQPIYPQTVTQAIHNAKTGASLEAILAQYNNVFLQYMGSGYATRNLLPMDMRRKGIQISYRNMDDDVICEKCVNDTRRDNDNWGLDANWERIDNLSLSGDISVSSKGTWVIDGKDTGINAVGPKGSNGLTPWLKTIGNKLYYSYDNVKWVEASDYLAAYFRWNEDRIQISRDKKTWTDLSTGFTNDIHIKGYKDNVGLLPSDAKQGDMYMVGTGAPYNLYIYNDGQWKDNGQFTGLTAGVVNEIGSSETEVMSQKAVCDIVGLSEYPAFSESEDYAVGDVVNKDGKLYEFTTEHAVGAWIGTDAEETSVKKELEKKDTELERKIMQSIGGNEEIPINNDAFNTIIVNLKKEWTIEDITDFDGYIMLSNDRSFSESVSYTKMELPISLSEDYKYLRVSEKTTNSFLKVFIKGLSTEIESLQNESWKFGTVLTGGVDKDKTDGIFRKSANLLDIRKAEEGKYIQNTTGETGTNADYYASDYISVKGGENYYLSYKHSLAWYDINKVYISGSPRDDIEKIQKAPDNAVYLRCSISKTYYNQGKCIVARSDEPVEYVPYIEPYIEQKYLYPIIKKSINLFNKNDSNVTFGKYVNSSTGELGNNTSYYASGYIIVEDGKDYYIPTCRGIAWYDKERKIISGLPNGTEGTIFKSPTGAVFLRCTIPTSMLSTWIVAESSEIVDFEPYDENSGLIPELIPSIPEAKLTGINIKQIRSSLGENSFSVNTEEFSDSIIYADNFPYYIKKGNCLSCNIRFDEFDKIDIGHGLSEYRGRYIRITETEIQEVVTTDELEEWVKTKTPHNLSISEFLRCSLYRDSSGKLLVIINSISGMFTTTFDFGYEVNGKPFVGIGETICSSLTFTCGNTDFKKEVWLIGDSYFGISTNRWPGVMRNWGFFNYLIDGLAGLSSQRAFEELNRLLYYGTPKYLVWCLGMNDTDENFVLYFENVKSICDSNGITLIASTIPSVPGRDKSYISNYVINSGKRYIDFAEAVTNSIGSWYDGFLSSDNVHPSELGAQSLASQVLIDFPEIMQYGIVSTDSEIGNITGDK